MKRAAWIAIAIAMVLDAAAARAWCRMTTSERQPDESQPCIFPDPTTDPPEQYLAWQRPCSAIALSVATSSEDLSEEDVYGILARSIGQWESVQCGGAPLGIDIAILEERSTCRSVLYRDDGGNANTVMFISDWVDREYDPAAFAVTTVWHRRSTGEILDVDMEINEARGPYGICPAEGCLDERMVDLENVVTHELGHYLGLAHSTDPDATMFASAVAGETLKRDLAPDDVEGICTIYPAGTPAGECDYAPIGGLDLDCTTGCSVSAVGAGATTAWPLLAIAASLLALRRRR